MRAALIYTGIKHTTTRGPFSPHRFQHMHLHVATLLLQTAPRCVRPAPDTASGEFGQSRGTFGSLAAATSGVALHGATRNVPSGKERLKEVLDLHRNVATYHRHL